MTPMGIVSVPWEHFCSVCQLLINPKEALQSMCGHYYCRPCLTHVANTTRACPYDGFLVTEADAKPLVESNKVSADTIGKTVVHCSYQNRGCTWAGSQADLLFHCSCCVFGYLPVTCSWCGINIPHRQWNEHVQVCLDAYKQASAAMATSQGQNGVSAATLTQLRQWYQQPCPLYHQHIQYHAQKMQLQSITAQHQAVIYVHVPPSVQTHCEMQPQPQVQSQSQPNQPHAYWTGMIPQPILSVPPLPQPPSHQTNQVGSPPNNLFEYHHDHFPGQSMSALPSQMTRDHYMHSSQQHGSASTSDAVHNQMHQEGPSYHPHHVALQEHQPMTRILGVQLTAPQVGLGQAEPSLSAVKEDEMQRIQNQVHRVSTGQDRLLDLFGNKDDEAVMEGNGIKRRSLGKQVMEENDGNGMEDLGKGPLLEEDDDPSLNCSPLMNPALLDQDALQKSRNASQFYFQIGDSYRASVEKSRASRHEKHEPEFDLRWIFSL